MKKWVGYLVLALALTSGCGMNPIRRAEPDVERVVAAEGMVVAQRLDGIYTAVGEAVARRELAGPEAAIVRSRLTGINQLGYNDLSNALSGIDTATTEESRFLYRKNALSAVSKMRGYIRECLAIFRTNHLEHLIALATEVEGLLDRMAVRLGVQA